MNTVTNLALQYQILKENSVPWGYGVIHVLWNLKVHYQAHRSVPLDYTSVIAIHVTSYLFCIHSNTILQSISHMFVSIQIVLLKFYMLFSSLIIHAIYLACFNILQFITPLLSSEYKLWSSPSCNFLHSPVTSSLIFNPSAHYFIFRHTQSMFLWMRDHFSHMYKMG